MKLLLCVLNSYQDSRSISIKVRCFAMEQPELDKLNILTFLGVI
jgi:hypothetical protein